MKIPSQQEHVSSEKWHISPPRNCGFAGAIDPTMGILAKAVQNEKILRILHIGKPASESSASECHTIVPLPW
jgi:hypothetical protein